MTRPLSPAEAVGRAKLLLLDATNKTHGYMLGTGDVGELPWTERDGVSGSDCAGFAICWCYGLTRHRPGFNVGSWATVSDDINVDSAIEDADHNRELFRPVVGGESPQPGDLLVYRTIRLPGHPLPWIGHVAIVVGVDRIEFGATELGSWSHLDVIQCCGPNGRSPAVLATDGSIWDKHDHDWGNVEERRSRLLRVVP